MSTWCCIKKINNYIGENGMEEEGEFNRLSSEMRTQAEEAADILGKISPEFAQLLIYMARRVGPTEVKNLFNPTTSLGQKLMREFDSKCDWVDYTLRKNNKPDVSSEKNAKIVNFLDEQVGSASAFKGKAFDGFIHYIVAFGKNASLLNSLITTWLDEGRTLEEVNSDGYTPIQMAIFRENTISFETLVNRGAVTTEIYESGLSLLHMIVGLEDIALLRLWIKLDLPTNIKCGEKAEEDAGKTAVECAQEDGRIEITKILNGDVQEAIKNFDKLFVEKKETILKKYHAEIESNPAKKSIIENDKNKLLLHYLVDTYSENYLDIGVEVFVKLLADKELGINTSLIINGKTALHKCVDLGYNDWALALVKMGVGGTSLDNGVTVLNYCVSENNDKLFDMIKEDSDLDIDNFAKVSFIPRIEEYKSAPAESSTSASIVLAPSVEKGVEEVDVTGGVADLTI